MSAYDFTVTNAEGASVDLRKYKGYVTLVVNTSRHDEKAKQNYELLASVCQKYKEDDVSVLLFPCAQFGPETSAQAEREFLHNNNLDNAGTLFKEVDVNGPKTVDFFKYLKQAKAGVPIIKCNFTIFILDRQGVVAERLTANVHPYALDELIEKYL